MPVLRTDDGPRKLRAVWLGPKGATLPFEWTYVQWSVTLLMIPVGVCLVWLLLALLGQVTVGHAPWFAFWFGLIYGAPASIYLAVRVMRNVSFDEPLRHKVATLRDELGRESRTRAEARTAWTMPWPRIGELDASVPGRWKAACEAAEEKK
ncbi:hypothetical protein FHX74_001281 [Friedmanniella endophytica]|uniref:Uncharacterized protein n=1 Tax=Microlunatus kandeliicorticis TaxID=1759536 RepID=A0A7W3IR15_9ACTN|nr:hypothetical protein [Microlunatus kandeliicorticis]MBA8793676.1 hypothetical protein [Microlunatus kandeliicorticis]